MRGRAKFAPSRSPRARADSSRDRSLWPAWRTFTAASWRRGISGDRGSDGFAEGAGPVLGDVNHVHPFREGNGRTQLQYLKQLAARAGHAIDLTRIDPAAWLDASRRSNAGDHDAMTRCIRQALV